METLVTVEYLNDVTVKENWTPGEEIPHKFFIADRVKCGDYYDKGFNNTLFCCRGNIVLFFTEDKVGHFVTSDSQFLNVRLPKRVNIQVEI